MDIASSNGEINDLGLHAEIIECAMAVQRRLETVAFWPFGSSKLQRKRFSEPGIIVSPFSVPSRVWYSPNHRLSNEYRCE